MTETASLWCSLCSVGVILFDVVVYIRTVLIILHAR